MDGQQDDDGTHLQFVPDASGVCSSSSCNAVESDVRCIARAASYSPGSTLVGSPEIRRATRSSSALTSAAERLATWLRVSSASTISSASILPFHALILSHLSCNEATLATSACHTKLQLRQATMAYQCLSKLSLSSFMPSMMELVTSESTTASGMPYLRIANVTVSAPIGKSCCTPTTHARQSTMRGELGEL